MKILVINGPNLNMLGIREPGIYGKENYETLCRRIREKAEALGVEVEIFQSNSEGELVTRIQQALGQEDAIIINPAAYTHTSIDSGCAESGGPAGGGGAHQRCDETGKLSPDFLCRDGLRTALHRHGPGGISAGDGRPGG